MVVKFEYVYLVDEINVLREVEGAGKGTTDKYQTKKEQKEQKM